MKTRMLAKALRQLATWLESIPDQSIDELPGQEMSPTRSAASLALNVATLASLSRIDRQAWMAFIREHHFPIEVRTRDASRDILGKLLKYLEHEPGAVDYLQKRADSEISSSPELSRALRALLNYKG